MENKAFHIFAISARNSTPDKLCVIKITDEEKQAAKQNGIYCPKAGVPHLEMIEKNLGISVEDLESYSPIEVEYQGNSSRGIDRRERVKIDHLLNGTS